MTTVWRSNRNWIVWLMAAFASSWAVPVAQASTATYYFNRITKNSSSSIGGQLQMTVKDSGSAVYSGDGKVHNLVTFHFANLIGVKSSITGVFFQDGTLLAWANVVDSDGSATGVQFNHPDNPADLPGGSDLNPDFKVSSYEGRRHEWSAGAQGTNPGVDKATEWVDVTFYLQTNKSFTDIIGALKLGYESPGTIWNSNGTRKTGSPDGLRVGLHVQSIGTDGKSDSYVNGVRFVEENTPSPVPEPASLMIVVGCFLTTQAIRFRRRHYA